MQETAKPSVLFVGDVLNAVSVQALEELAIDLTGERLKPIAAQVVRDVDVAVTLGRDDIAVRVVDLAERLEGSGAAVRIEDNTEGD